ncbi:uncharacterized protein KY384_007659 [Bacidia gigantensis]|uniref:uncharacterized protein n=1 Tax=Bacidia gigantensis TaxID=2732470 RepID=UPI001D0574FB|nr:uncharacterized protein KY384_007659 [Bacidia gigantensis]KAG8527507.1 hypothetical protein KY384_007659 [Bacidia gigantensis]
MPPGRRGRPAGSTSTPKTQPQQRLTFGPNATNKITKPSPLGRGEKKLSPSAKTAIEKEITAPETPREETSAEEVEEEDDKAKALPIRQQERKAEQSSSSAKKSSVKKTERDVKEVEALKVSEAQIKKYWILKEQARIAPRVHQQGLSVYEKVLREFDLTRTKRWKRADGLGLKPPLEVLAVLLKEEEKDKGRRNAEVERAYVDSLMGGRLTEIEA